MPVPLGGLNLSKPCQNPLGCMGSVWGFTLADALLPYIYHLHNDCQDIFSRFFTFFFFLLTKPLKRSMIKTCWAHFLIIFIFVCRHSSPSVHMCRLSIMYVTLALTFRVILGFNLH